MAFTLEDGTGVTGANSYASTDDLKIYAKDRGISLDAYEGNSIKQQALVRASKDWIDGHHTLKGDSSSTTQGMHFPTDEDDLPQDIIDASCLAAILHLQGALFVDVTTISTSGDIESESKGLGTLKKSVTYRQGSSQRYGRVLPRELTNLIQPYLKFSGGMGSSVRV